MHSLCLCPAVLSSAVECTPTFKSVVKETVIAELISGVASSVQQTVDEAVGAGGFCISVYGKLLTETEVAELAGCLVCLQICIDACGGALLTVFCMKTVY